MSDQKPPFIKTTHTAQSLIGEDRTVRVDRTEDGGMVLEWCTRDPSNGYAVVCTKVRLSEEAALATALCMTNIFTRVQEEEAAKTGAADD